MMLMELAGLCFLLLLPACSWSQSTSIRFVEPASCSATQFYNIVSFSCQPCGEPRVKGSDGLSCTCKDGYAEVDLGSPLVTCNKCNNSTVSLDKKMCLTCAGSGCSCGANQVREENLVAKTYTCTTCNGDTVANSAGDQCVQCQQTMVSSNCSCLPNLLTGGLCFPDVKQSLTEVSLWESLFLESSVLACKNYDNITACQLLTNMVTLNAFSWESIAYNQYDSLYTSTIKKTYLPQLFYSSSSSLVVLGSTAPTTISFQKNSRMQFKITKYDARGNFLGWEDVKGASLQLCPNTQNILDAAFKFGTSYTLSCTLQLSDLLQQVPEPVFYELFFSYTNSSGASLLWPVPVWNSDLQASTNSLSSKPLRRFFLVDGISGRQGSLSSQPTYLTVATGLTLRVYLPVSPPGTEPPFQLTVKYEKKQFTSRTVQVSFSVTYSNSQGTYKRDTDIALGVLGSLATLYAIVRTNSWLRRSRHQNIDFTIIITFLAFLSGALANTFFIIALGIAIYWLIAFKGQNSSVNVSLPPIGGQIETDFIIYVSVAFALKTLELLHLFVTQLSLSIFFIDWEKPKDKISSSQGKPNVSFWRTILVANEWNEIQTHRKLSPLFQIFIVLLLLEVVGLKNITARDLNLDLNPATGTYLASWSIILRFGISACMWLAVGLVQVLFFVFIYERFFEDKIQQFVDICSLSNVSVFILTHRCYGYYIHGRSVHGQADVSMETMLDNLRKEEENLCPLRGLEPGSDMQTFEILLSDRVQEQYEKIVQPLIEAPRRQKGGSDTNPLLQQRLKTYYTINRFLASFLEHVYKDMDYVVQDKLALEHILDMEFQQPTEKSVLYSDDRARFSRSLFYGNELVLLLFDTLLFCIVDLGTQNFVLAAIITYVVQMFASLLRSQIGRKNLSKQTMVEENFLI
ncbi:meckelin [Bombina bombina]|uniref:meckelin n=1 Tax=Bombina bombina TaxID=8345 RepID=UPI00235A7C92|nr:meckelin [Bombina bombina]